MFVYPIRRVVRGPLPRIVDGAEKAVERANKKYTTWADRQKENKLYPTKVKPIMLTAQHERIIASQLSHSRIKP